MTRIDREITTAPAGLERWLTSRPRLVLVALAAAAAATAATSMGELELLRASDMTTDEAERDVVVQTGAIWLAWALVSPLLFAIAFQLAQSARHWTIAALCHLPLAFGVGSAFLAGEIAVQEALQGPEDTDLFRRLLEVREEARERGWGPEGRRGWSGRAEAEGRRREGRGNRDDQIVPRELPLPPAERAPALGPGSADDPLPDSPDDEARQDTGRENRVDADDRGTRRPPFTRDEFRRLRRMGRSTTANVATGDLAADFERRWRLRVPRYGLIYLALILIGLGSRAFLLGRQREREAVNLELRAERLEAELVEARLTALKGQLHPHFLFNALHSVGGLIRSADPGRALTALAQIGDLLRTSLDAGGEQFVTLGREIELLHRYLDVEALRLGEKLRVEFAVDPALEECEVPAFITQPLVENAVKHGVAQRPEGGCVAITARAIDGEILEIAIENDGPAPPETPREGVGLAHVRTRLETLFEGAGSLCLERLSEREGARAVLRLPLDDVAHQEADDDR
ncbi:MAG: histidine kinase [Planctomycetota bacterium]|nr:histidine kinase [Planctomycetota bacterium]